MKRSIVSISGCLATVLLVAGATANAQTVGMESDWLEFVKGHHEDKLGADVMDVSYDAATGERQVMIAIPKESMGDDPDMEEVRVVGQAPEEFEMPDILPEVETQWVDDYDNDNYGLLVKFKKDQRLPFRLFFSSGDGFLDNSVQP
ncbi:MAG: hypothetical protein AAGI88_25155 [Pseudomonadota bacterium]